VASPRNFDEALAALNAELADIAQWSRAPQYVHMREMKQRGQLDIDYQGLEERLSDLRPVMPTARLVEYDACVQQLVMAFGELIIHASISYEDELNVMEGWSRGWRKLDNALKGMKVFLATLARAGGETGQAHGAGGPRTDLFGNERGCA
jgi:hypothetical protein